MKTRATASLVFLSLLFAANAAAETITRGNKLTVDASSDGRLLMGLMGKAWVVPHSGGEAQLLIDSPADVRAPRWSPDRSSVVFTSGPGGNPGLWVYRLAGGQAERIGNGNTLVLQPAWHPDGERVIFAAPGRDTGLDIWEADLATGLQWRLSDRPGDETHPAWSNDGRDLVYVHHFEDQWSLILRRHGQPDEVLVSGPDRLAGPSWRPDGSLIMYWRDSGDGQVLDMVILSQPRLVRPYTDGENFSTAPVSWLDKHRMFYTADGVIRQRLFNAWSSRTVPFRALIDAAPAVAAERVRRTLPRVDEPRGTLIIHAERLFDGIAGSYQYERDIIIDGGRIRAVEAHAERPGEIVIDMGDLAVLPGLVDVRARLPDGTVEATGPLLLAAGVTTLVTDQADAEHLNRVWSGKELPGPRLLPADDWEVSGFSGLADSETPALGTVLNSRAASLIGFDDVVARRFGEAPSIDHGATDVVLGSRPNGMPAGIAAHAELHALVAAGLRPEQALRAASVNAAAALGVDPNLGRIATGAVADLVLVDGDPLNDVGAALNVVAIVRNGRFFSVAGLIERAQAAKTVE